MPHIYNRGFDFFVQHRIQSTREEKNILIYLTAVYVQPTEE